MSPPTDIPEQPAARRPAKPGSAARAPERGRLTSRAAVLGVVFCAIAMSLAYPVREYIGQHRQIDQLEAQQQSIAGQLSKLEKEHKQLTSNAYVEQQARDRLHMCSPKQQCYVIINPKPPPGRAAAAHAPGTPWYQRLWGGPAGGISRARTSRRARAGDGGDSGGRGRRHAAARPGAPGPARRRAPLPVRPA
jgi:cell division protein FtsB